MHIKLCIFSELSLGEKPTRCEAGTESYGSYKTARLPIENFFMKNIKKEEKLMKVKSVIINSLYIFNFPLVSNHNQHYSVQHRLVTL